MERGGLVNAMDFIMQNSSEETQRLFAYDDILYTISTYLHDYRITHGWKRKKMAKILGVSKKMVTEYESAEHDFSIRELWKILQKLNVNLAVITTLSNGETLN